MSVVRRVARPMLASTFVWSGVDVLRNPGSRVAKAEAVTPAITQWVPWLPDDTEQLVKINAGAQLAGGLLLGSGRLPRLAALVLAGSLVPTTAAGHPFWQEQDPAARKAQQVHFLKNVSMLGGLLITAVDTGGRPSIGWRARRAGRNARRLAKVSRAGGKASAKAASGRPAHLTFTG